MEEFTTVEFSSLESQKLCVGLFQELGSCDHYMQIVCFGDCMFWFLVCFVSLTLTDLG